MGSRSPQSVGRGMKVRDITLIGLLAAILFVLQVVLAPLPNIEMVSLLVILYALLFGKRVFYIVYVFALLEGLVYGFGIWWVMYLYLWPLLAIIVLVLQKNDSVWVWAILSGFFGLAFGFLCAIPYFFTGGFSFGITYWVSGIPFDIVHGISNFLIALFLFKPLHRVLSRLKKQTAR